MEIRANETLRAGADQPGHRRQLVFWIPWSARRVGTPETGETCVVVLITQRSRVQIPPLLLVFAGKGPFPPRKGPSA
jgi:hypothetical protein